MIQVKVKVTPYVNIKTLKNGDEKRYWFKVPVGENRDVSAKKAQEIIDQDIINAGRNPMFYTFLVGKDENGLTMRAVYDYEREKLNKTHTTEIEAHRNRKEVQKVIKGKAR